jgi:predicted transcriptional regulator of viral defense system
MVGQDFITELAAGGRYTFSTQDLVDRHGGSVVAARAVLRRLRAKGAIASPMRGFQVIVPPEYRVLGCLPAEQFVPQLMEHLALPYYIGLLSAARYHGAAHQQPQVFQVLVACNRPSIRCGKVAVDFVARGNLVQVPTVRFETPRGPLLVSSPEATAFDLVGYMEHAGGVDNVATLLRELADVLEPAKLAGVAALSPVAWAQRLGFLLEQVGAGHLVGPLASLVRAQAREYRPLVPGTTPRVAERSAPWRLILNTEVEADQ